MAKILVAGGLDLEDQDEKLRGAREAFATRLGAEIIQRGHVLLGGCRTTLDATVAASAAAAATERKIDPRKCVKSWVTKSTTPSHAHGEIVRSSVLDWSQVPRGFAFPEPVREADVVIIIGGWDGTHFAASWARLANKPLVPVAAFGMAAMEIFGDELSNFDRRYGARLSVDNYQILNRLLTGYSDEVMKGFASDVLSLAEQLIRSTDVFVMMPFADKPYLKDAYNTFKSVCKDFGFNAFRVDKHLDANQRIVPNIMESIRRAAFIIADVSGEARANVYFELGYAHALGKEVITTAQQGTELPFDIFDVPVQFWDSQDMLDTKIRPIIAGIANKYGRAIGS